MTTQSYYRGFPYEMTMIMMMLGHGGLHQQTFALDIGLERIIKHIPCLFIVENI